MKIIDKQTIKIALVVIGILASVAVYQFDKKGQEDIRAARQGAAPARRNQGFAGPWRVSTTTMSKALRPEMANHPLTRASQEVSRF